MYRQIHTHLCIRHGVQTRVIHMGSFALLFGPRSHHPSLMVGWWLLVHVCQPQNELSELVHSLSWQSLFNLQAGSFAFLFIPGPLKCAQIMQVCNIYRFNLIMIRSISNSKKCVISMHTVIPWLTPHSPANYIFNYKIIIT
jgi:hypothetical protein